MGIFGWLRDKTIGFLYILAGTFGLLVWVILPIVGFIAALVCKLLIGLTLLGATLVLWIDSSEEKPKSPPE